MTSHLLCAMFAKALCANIGRNFPCVRNDVIYSFWKKNYGEYNFPMNCVWENNMKLNSLVAAHIIIIIFLAVAAMLRSSSAYAHMSCSVIFHPFSQCYGWCSTYTYIGTQGASYWSLSQFSMFFMEHNISNEENLAAKKIVCTKNSSSFLFLS